VQVEQIDDAAEFLRRTVALREAEPVLTNLVGTVAQSVADGRRFDRCWWWVVSDETGEAVACAMRTAPWSLALGPMPPAAAAALGPVVAVADPGLPGVVGPSDAVHALVAALPGTPVTRVTMNDVVHVLDDLVDPPTAPGRPVDANPGELDLLVEWHEAFARDAGLPSRDMRQSVEQRLAQGGLLWWQVDGQPVSMAGHTRPLPAADGSVARIGPVYTPQPFRRRGYGSAVTAAVVRRLLPRCTVIMLFADAANRTSNGVYARLGFRPTAELVEVELVGAMCQESRQESCQ
jgi:predicted GNAT family acetyltransferase